MKSQGNAPTSYGGVEDAKNYDDVEEVEEGFFYVLFVVIIESEWYDKNEANVLRDVYRDNYLTLYSYPPTDCVNTEPYSDEDFMR